MREGWVEGDYLILFDADELAAASASYSFFELLPGYKLLGLRGWDDFVVENNKGRFFTVPTVPVCAKYLAPFQLPVHERDLTADEQFIGKIKWYVKPVIFGGDPSSHQNQIWVDHSRHAQLVRYWNKMYRSITAKAE